MMNPLKTALTAFKNTQNRSNKRKAAYSSLKATAADLKPQLQEKGIVPWHAKGLTWSTQFGKAALTQRTITYRLRQDEQLVVSVDPINTEQLLIKHQQKTPETHKKWEDIVFSELNDKTIKLEDLPKLIEDYTDKVEAHHDKNRVRNYLRKGRQAIFAGVVAAGVYYVSDAGNYNVIDSSSFPPLSDQAAPQNKAPEQYGNSNPQTEDNLGATPDEGQATPEAGLY